MVFDFSFVHIEKQKPSSHELVFEAHLPPMGFNTYYIKKTAEITTTEAETPTPSDGSIRINSNLSKKPTHYNSKLLTFGDYVSI